MKKQIIDIIAEYLDVNPDELLDYKTLVDVNIDSLDFAEIMFEIEEKFDVEIMFEMQSHKNEIGNLGDVVRLIETLIVKQKASQSADDGE